MQGTLVFEDGDDRLESWIVADGGSRGYVVWRSGFNARRHSGDLVLIDDRGAEIFRAGDEVELPQVDVRTHAGTIEDPYVASGLFAGQCWVGPPDQFGG